METHCIAARNILTATRHILNHIHPRLIAVLIAPSDTASMESSFSGAPEPSSRAHQGAPGIADWENDHVA